MLKQLFIVSTLVIGTGAVQAANVTGANCNAPTLVLTFGSTVTPISVSATSSTTTGLTAVKFKKNSSSSETVELPAANCEFNSANTQCTMYVTNADYEDTYDWNVWPIAVEATADGDTATVACQD